MNDANRQVVRTSKLSEQGKEDDLRSASVEELWGMMWQLAVDAWAMKGENVGHARAAGHHRSGRHSVGKSLLSAPLLPAREGSNNRRFPLACCFLSSGHILRPISVARRCLSVRSGC
jgi:hypothetical protein